MNIYQRFEQLGRQQQVFQDGVEMLQQIKIDLEKAKSSADMWGNIAVMSQAVLVPLKMIVNAFPAPVPKSNYQKIALTLLDVYKKGKEHKGKFDKIQQGDILGLVIKEGTKRIKEEAEKQLTAKGLAHYIPGIKILAGLAEDSATFIKTAMDVNQGSDESKSMLIRTQQKIDEATNKIIQLGIMRSDLWDQMSKQGVVA